MPQRSRPPRAPRPSRAPAATARRATADGRVAWAVAAALAVAAATMFTYRGVYDHTFLDYDDASYVTENGLVLGRHWAALLRAVVSHNWHPLTMWSLAWNVTTPLSPRPFLATNVLLHAVGAMLAFGLAWLLSGRRLLVAAWVGLVFGLHPMHVESVAWIAERKDVLYALWFLAGAIGYTLYVERRERRWLAATFACFVLACLAKGMAVSFPLVMVLIDVWKRRPLEKGAVLEKLPFFAVAAVFGLVAVDVQAGGNVFGLLQPMGAGGAVIRTIPHSLFERLALPAYGYMMYVWKLLVPARLCALDPFPPPGQILRPEYVAGPLFLIASLALAAWDARRTRILAFGIGWYFATVAFVLQWLPVGQAIMADRYTYIPYVGLAFALGMGIETLATRRRAIGTMLRVASLLFAVFLAVRSTSQIETWRDGGTLWSRVIEIHPDADQAYVWRGGFEVARGRMDEARRDFVTARSLGNHTAPLYTGLGVVHATQGRADSALVMFDQALQLSPRVGRTHYDRALVLAQLGRRDEALAELDRALALAPGLAPTILATRGTLRAQLGDARGAVADLDRALAAGVTAPALLHARAISRLALGDTTGARADLADALRRTPATSSLGASIRALAARLGAAPR